MEDGKKNPNKGWRYVRLVGFWFSYDNPSLDMEVVRF